MNLMSVQSWIFSVVSLPGAKFFSFAEQMSSRSLRKLQEQKDDIQEDPEENGEDVETRGKSSFNAFLLVRSDPAGHGDQFGSVTFSFS